MVKVMRTHCLLNDPWLSRWGKRSRIECIEPDPGNSREFVSVVTTAPELKLAHFAENDTTGDGLHYWTTTLPSFDAIGAGISM